MAVRARPAGDSGLSDTIITPLRPIPFTMRDGSLSPMGTGREPGIHMSDLVREMKVAAGEKVGAIEGEDPNARPQAGFWWERGLIWAQEQHLLADGLVPPDTIWQPHLSMPALGGVLPISPDGLYLGGDVGTARDKPSLLFSVKLTWKSMRKWQEGDAPEAAATEANFWSWFVHDMAAMKALRTTGYNEIIYWANTVRYFHFWVRGDYSWGPEGKGGPQPTTCDVTFTDEQIDANWASTLRYYEYVAGKQRKES